MSVAGVAFRGAWKAWHSLMGPKTRGDLREELRRAVREQLVLLRKDILAYIDAAGHGVANSPLTVLTKRGNRPLIDRGYLRTRLRLEGPVVEGAWVVGGVGIRRTDVGHGGRNLGKIALMLHNGGTVKVTPRVRAAVFAALRERGRGRRNMYTKGVELLSSGSGASEWRIRPRPFVEVPFEKAQERIRVALGGAVEFSLVGTKR